jgi:hypothetical protein
MYTLEHLEQKSLKELKEIGWQLNVLPASDRRFRQNWIDAIAGVNFPLLQLLEVSPAASAVEQVQPIIEMVETPSAVEVEPAQESPIGSKFGRIVYSRSAQESIVQSVENSPGVDPGVDVDRAQELIDIQRHEVIELQAQDLIEQAVENSLDVEFSGFERVTQSNRNNFSGFERVTQSNRKNFSGFERFQEPEESDHHLILTGLTFSDRFLARYAPPQAQIIHFQSDADGQLSLLDFEVQSVDEPPDPDDFESLELFREALALWDWEHNEVSPEHNEPLQVSLDSFSLWGFCPADWYESVALLEPPDTGIFAKLPKPNPLSFPPATVGQVRAKRSPNSAQTQSKRISNAYQTHTCCILAGSSIQPARSPPRSLACLLCL